MNTLTIGYDASNSLAESIVNSIRQSGVFTVFEKSEYYNSEFVEKIHNSERQFSEGKYKSINTNDLWK